MKSILLLTIFFLLFAFTTNLSLALPDLPDFDQVRDIRGVPLFPYKKYFISPWPTVTGPNGGLNFEKINDSKCSITVVQEFSQYVEGTPVRFRYPSITAPGEIYPNSGLLVEFANKPDCVESPRWLVLIDNVTKKKFISIGGPENYHGVTILNGTFSLPRAPKTVVLYNIKFCPLKSQNCMYVGISDKGEDARPLILSAKEALQVMFVPVRSYEAGNY